MTSRLLPNAAATHFLPSLLWVCTGSLHAAQLTRESVLAETLKPYTGASVRGVPAAASVSIEHEREGGKEELEFQLKWKREQKP